MEWAAYADRYLALLRQRNLQEKVRGTDLDSACLLCSEHRPEHCHRSLLAEYLREAAPQIEVVHLY
jgi:uncharacterized protein YeaO (DUF488 family)